MNTPSNAKTHAPYDSPGAGPANMAKTRPLYWSIKRELWENRSLTVAPLAVAGFVVFVLLMTAFALPRKMRALSTLVPAAQHTLVVRPFSTAATVIMMTTILVGIFFSLDALYGERRDRSILFWKSLPVSDSTTLLSKAAIPLVALPLFGFALSVAAQAILLLWSTAVLIGAGLSPATLWSEFRFFQMPLTMLYGIVVFTLWHAPLYAWLLLVSGWARRTPALWAALPFLAISIVEKAAFNTAHSLKYLFTGAMSRAFHLLPGRHFQIIDRLAELDPAKFLAAPGLWIGLLVAAALLAAAARMRRNREPL